MLRVKHIETIKPDGELHNILSFMRIGLLTTRGLRKTKLAIARDMIPKKMFEAAKIQNEEHIWEALADIFKTGKVLLPIPNPAYKFTEQSGPDNRAYIYVEHKVLCVFVVNPFDTKLDFSAYFRLGKK